MINKQTKALYGTKDRRYATRFIEKESLWWKRLIDVQAPYRWNLRRLQTGFTLEVGCGVGRNLLHLAGNGVGVDHNAYSVAIARSRGCEAFTPDEFLASPFNRDARFDSLLLAHVVEHMTESAAIRLINAYLYALKPGGKLILIAPQEMGYRSDPTHVQFMDMAALERIVRAVGLEPVKAFSFPFPRPVGHLFRYNEFVTISTKPGQVGK